MYHYHFKKHLDKNKFIEFGKEFIKNLDRISNYQNKTYYRQKNRINKKTCMYWNCKEKTYKQDFYFCYSHWGDVRNGLVDECPKCHRAKDTSYGYCLDCDKQMRTFHNQKDEFSKPKKYNRYAKEYSPKWDKEDAKTNKFFVYILVLKTGKFYAGQTRSLRERMMEHKDNMVKSTANQEPKLVWFSQCPSREIATSLESNLKVLVDKNPRKIRTMIIEFEDLMNTLDIS
tara:strand:- start:30 stop:716 length:687 start_codon:yes stop_codon:yes gene_type:complete